MKAKLNILVVLSLLLGLVVTVPAQAVSAQELAPAYFTFNSTPNPSNYGQPVAFTLSATGDDPKYQPFGYVDFFDNGIAIDGCSTVSLNLTSGPVAGVPAVCTTSALAVGSHVITAEFGSLDPWTYDDAIVTLQNGPQNVNEAIALTITPETLADGMLNIWFEQQLTATFPDGSECTTCTWYGTGSGRLPDGVGLFSSGGVLQGTPTETGVFTFTVVADNGNGARGSREYTLTVTKITPVVEVDTAMTYVGNTQPTTLSATARHLDEAYNPRPVGKMSFSVAGVPVPGCSGEAAITTNNYGEADCNGYLPTGLAAGYYPILAEFSPNETSSGLYQAGSGTGTLQVYASQPVTVTGLVFMDDDNDGVRDGSERAQGNWNVFLNQDCDSFLDLNTVTNPYTGEFTFTNVPTDHTYCLFVNLTTWEGYTQTTTHNNLTLVGGEHFEIGLYHPHLTILPASEELPLGKVGTYYEQVFQVSGGTPPYSIEVSYDETYPLPDGLSFDQPTLTLSGTPTAVGMGTIHFSVADTSGLTGNKTYSLMVQVEGTFDLTSSANPSNPGQEVTFTLTGSGDFNLPDFGPAPPFGVVAFSDGDAPIIGCEEILLNFNENLFEPQVSPATCTTSTLTEGQHTIKADFQSITGWYPDAVTTLTQQVEAAASLTISPESLPDAAFQTSYSQQLSASGGTAPYTYSLLTGSLPDGITLGSDGLLSGKPDGTPDSILIGTYPITVQVEDENGATGSRDFNLVLDKGVPTMTAGAQDTISWHLPFNLWADVRMGTSRLYGTVAFSIDDQPVPSCQAVTMSDGYYPCQEVSMDLSVGDHAVKATYTPTGWYADYYASAYVEFVITVQPRYFNIHGSFFKDQDQDGVMDADEAKLWYWTVNLDQGCDGTVDRTADVFGDYGFYNVTGGECYRITPVVQPGWKQTTAQLADFTLNDNTFGKYIGFYYPTIDISPIILPDGAQGQAYSQTLSASGGTEPYTFTISDGALPAGLSLSTGGVLSGTPTAVGYYDFSVTATDANQAAGWRSYAIWIKADGDFTFTSSANPSTAGDAVTFTVSATGDVVTPYGAYPPSGSITFFVDGTPIEGCSDVYLNISPEFAPGDIPATCTTAALEAGSHEITAAYTDWTSLYNAPSLILTQVVKQPITTYRIGGTVFKDIDQDGVFDSGEPLTGEEWTIKLDQACDGTVEQTNATVNGYYEFTGLEAGQCYRVSEDSPSLWTQPAALADILSLSQDITNLDIGKYPRFVIAQDTPKGDVGVPYSFQYSISGPGKEPYTYALVDNEFGQPSTLPAGLTLTPEGLLSGTPTEGGVFALGVQATDADGALSRIDHPWLTIAIDGSFNLISSSNPSNPGDSVTFTLTAAGDMVYPQFGPVPPIGYVTFLDGETPIEGCSQLLLNFLVDENGQPVSIGDIPASCSTGPLTAGTHTIKAVYTDPGTHWYKDTTLTLEQVVQPAIAADLSITKTDKTDPVRPGAKLEYTLVVSNSGPDAAESLSLVDKLDVTTTFSAVSAPKGWKCSYDKVSGKVTCTAAKLASGASATIKITVTVSKKAKVGKELVNNASISSATFDPDLLNNTVVEKTMVVK